MRFSCFILLIISLTRVVTAQYPVNNDLNKKISVEYLTEDFDLLTEKLKSSQPGLYLYSSKDSLGKKFETIKSSVTEPMTPIEFYRTIAPLNKILGNLHTRFRPSDTDEKAIDEDVLRIPLDIYWHNGKMYVLRNLSSNDKVLSGSVVVRINGEPAETIFQKVTDSRVRDGFNESYPIDQASRNFNVLYAQLIGSTKTYVIEVIAPDGSFQKFELGGLKGAEINRSRISKYNRKYSQYCEDWDAWIADKEPALRFEIRDHVAIMTLRTFYLPAIEAAGQNYDEFFRSSFSQLIQSKTRNFVIDLRNNHGGSDLVGMSLLSHFLNSPIDYYKRRSSILKPILKSKKVGALYEIEGRGPWIGKVTPASDVYTGAVYVLMNGYSVSATAELIGHLKNIDRATFIGEETGGNPVIFTGGQTLPIDLPHSHLRGSIPLHLMEMNVRMKNTGHGVIPDYELRPSIKDILGGRDVEMELAFKLINEKQ